MATAAGHQSHCHIFIAVTAHDALDLCKLYEQLGLAHLLVAHEDDLQDVIEFARSDVGIKMTVVHFQINK